MPKVKSTKRIAQPNRRAYFDEDETRLLNDFFHKCAYPTLEVKRLFADRLEKPLGKIKNWFKNQRARSKVNQKPKNLKTDHLDEMAEKLIKNYFEKLSKFL